jgi:hypothetical protein
MSEGQKKESQKESKRERLRRFLSKAKGTHFYLIPIVLSGTYAALAYVPENLISNSVKFVIVGISSVSVLVFLYLWIILSEVPNKYARLKLRELELTTKENEFEKREAYLEGRVNRLQKTLEHLKYPIRYHQFRREITLSKNIGESEQTWDMTVENITDKDIYEMVLPSRSLDLYDVFGKECDALKKQNVKSPEEVVRKAFAAVEKIQDVLIADKSLDKASLLSILYDLTVQHRRFSLRGSYVDELTTDGEGDVAEVLYKIPLEGENKLEPGKPKRIVFRVYNKCAFMRVLEDETTSLKVERLYDEAVITIQCPDGYEIMRNPVKGSSNGLKVINSATMTLDKDELDLSSNAHTDSGNKRIVWTISKPKVGHVYIIHFKISPSVAKTIPDPAI